MKKYEIWIGLYHLGQGYEPPTKPEKLAEIEATTFKVACLLYEHQNAIESLQRRMNEGGYIEDIHFGRWYYHPETNSNSWTSKYYESKEDALKSFTSSSDTDSDK